MENNKKTDPQESNQSKVDKSELSSEDLQKTVGGYQYDMTEVFVDDVIAKTPVKKD